MSQDSSYGPQEENWIPKIRTKTMVPKERTSRPMGPKRIRPASPMLCTYRYMSANPGRRCHKDLGFIPSGCLSLNWIKIQAVNSPNTPRKTITTIPGTRPTTASDEGKESIPLLTISAIIRTATSSHDSVLYLILEGAKSQSTARGRKIRNTGRRFKRFSISVDNSG